VDATDLGVEALRLSGNMGQFSKAAFQQGALGLPFQFMSYSTKMIQYMMPRTKMTSWIASDVLSNAEKGKVALWQAALFGTGGLGVSGMFADGAAEAGIEIDPIVQNRLEEGLAGLALESVFTGLTGTEGDINISGVMGPLNSIFGDAAVVLGKSDRAATPLGKLYNILGDFATGMPVGADQYLGAAGGVMNNATGIVGNIHKIWLNPQFGVGEKLELQMRDLATFLPAANNALQARIQWNTGEHVTKYGTLVAQVTLAESLSKGLIGIGSEKSNNVYDLQAKMGGDSQRMKPPTFKELSRSGKEMASFTYNAFRQLSNGLMTDQEVMDRMEATRAATFQAYTDQTDRDVFQANFRKEMIRLMGTKESLADQLVRIMASDAELRQEQGWDKIIAMVGDVSNSPYAQYVIENAKRAKENEAGSKLNFEATP